MHNCETVIGQISTLEPPNDAQAPASSAGASAAATASASKSPEERLSCGRGRSRRPGLKGREGVAGRLASSLLTNIEELTKMDVHIEQI